MPTDRPDTPAKLREARELLGLTQYDMATLLGYKGKHRQVQLSRMENGDREIHEAQVRLVEAYLAGHRPKDWPLC